MKSCVECLLPEGNFGIRIRTDGRCNLCHHYDTQEEMFPKANEFEFLLRERFEHLKGRYEYDALVGLSGGKDSTYVLYQLINKYKLNVLAVTYDNCFLTEEAKQNITEIVNCIGVNHIFVDPVEPAMKLLYKSTLRRHGWPCITCFVSNHFLALNYCTENRIPFYITGRSPYQLLRSYSEKSKDPTIELIRLNKEKHSFEKLYKFYRKLKWFHRIWMLWLIREREERTLVTKLLLNEPKMDKNFAPEILNFFLFEPYDEEQMKKFLEARDIGYKRPQHDMPLGHGDCHIHEAATHLYRCRTGVSMIALELAVMLRQRKITVSEARSILKLGASPPVDLFEKSVDHFCQYFDISRQEYDSLCRNADQKKPGFWGH